MNTSRHLPRLSTALSALSSTLSRSLSRSLSTTPHSAPTIAGLLSAASTANPLKDAVKFIQTSNTTIWTYRELQSHVTALAAGLHELGYASQTILTLLPPHTPEYPVLLLAAANIGAKLIPCPVPSDPAALDLQVLRNALNQHRPSALFISKEYHPNVHTDDDAIIASVNPILQALDPHVALDDAAGRDGFVPLTGRPFKSRQFPFLRHVVHTSDTNMRGTITFKSLLVYSGESPTSTTHSAPLLAVDGVELTEKQLIAQAETLGQKLGLSPDHTARDGKLVIKPGLGHSTAAAVVAAVMHETLWVSPGAQDTADVSSSENALVA